MVQDIRDLVKDKKVVFVGNSVEIMNYKLAEFIDKFDIIVHFGKAMLATPEQRESLGSRTDIWITGTFRMLIYNQIRDKFLNGDYANTKILMNRSRANIIELDGKRFEDEIPKGMPYSNMFSDEECVELLKEFGIKPTDNYRFSAGFWSILYFLRKVKTHKSLDLIGFDFFAKTTNKRRYDSPCDPHSWHLPIYIKPRSAHDSRLEQDYVSQLAHKDKLNWHVLTDLKEECIEYNDWLEDSNFDPNAKIRKRKS